VTEHSTSEGGERPPTIGRFMLKMGIYVVLGAPLVAILWHTVNDILALNPQPSQLLIALPAALLMAGLLYLLNRSIKQWLGPTA
jgi:predicted transporter